jgi:hypothetical protein
MIVFRLLQKYDFYLVKDYSLAIILMGSKKDHINCNLFNLYPYIVEAQPQGMGFFYSIIIFFSTVPSL